MVAARLGFEPRYPAPEAGVLPLDDLAIVRRTPLRGAPLWYTESRLGSNSREVLSYKEWPILVLDEHIPGSSLQRD